MRSSETLRRAPSALAAPDQPPLGPPPAPLAPPPMSPEAPFKHRARHPVHARATAQGYLVLAASQLCLAVDPHIASCIVTSYRLPGVTSDLPRHREPAILGPAARPCACTAGLGAGEGPCPCRLVTVLGSQTCRAQQALVALWHSYLLIWYPLAFFSHKCLLLNAELLKLCR